MMHLLIWDQLLNSCLKAADRVSGRSRVRFYGFLSRCVGIQDQVQGDGSLQ